MSYLTAFCCCCGYQHGILTVSTEEKNSNSMRNIHLNYLHLPRTQIVKTQAQGEAPALSPCVAGDSCCYICFSRGHTGGGTAVVVFVFPEDTQVEVQLLLGLFFQRTHRWRYSCCQVCFSRGHTGGSTAVVTFVFPEDTQGELPASAGFGGLFDSNSHSQDERGSLTSLFDSSSQSQSAINGDSQADGDGMDDILRLCSGQFPSSNMSVHTSHFDLIRYLLSMQSRFGDFRLLLVFIGVCKNNAEISAIKIVPISIPRTISFPSTH